MITRLDRNRLHAEKECLLDELAEESRLENMPPNKVSAIRDFVIEKHNECVTILRENNEDVEDVIKMYRGLIRKLLKS
jgi:hypothetical protein